jgi:molybdopterin-containing oxidoreductase family membrane subunit
VPSTLHEIVEYRPSLTEWKITWGIWAFGFMIYTLLIKITINIHSQKMRDAKGKQTLESTDSLAASAEI